MLHSLETKNNTDADAAVTQKRAGLDKEIAKAVKAGDQEKVRDLFEQKENSTTIQTPSSPERKRSRDFEPNLKKRKTLRKKLGTKRRLRTTASSHRRK